MNKRGVGIVRVELNHMNPGTARVLKETIALFREVSAYLIHVACDHASELLPLDSYQQLTAMEKLIHKTKDNPSPLCRDFDLRFYKLPSYIRRSAIHFAIGHVQSHETRCDQYYEYRDAVIARGKHFHRMEPAFCFTPNACPTLYRNNSFVIEDNGGIAIKARIRNTWDWITVSAPNRDLKHLYAAAKCGTLKNPKLVYEYHKFYLEFPVCYKCKPYPTVALKKQAVVGCDLGLNNGAVLSVVDYFGTVHGRHFSPFKADMDRIDHTINLIRKYARLSGRGQSLASLYTKLQGLKDNYTRQLSRWIVNRAVEAGAYGIVLEHLDRMRGRRRLAARTHHWCTAKIRDYVIGMAAREGIRVFIINPKGTSMYAYDGSGRVERNKKNYSLCTFATGKQYNCDLSASYNIAARYFIRAIQKSMSAKAWSGLTAKVPELEKRTTWTLASLCAISSS